MSNLNIPFSCLAYCYLFVVLISTSVNCNAKIFFYLEFSFFCISQRLLLVYPDRTPFKVNIKDCNTTDYLLENSTCLSACQCSSAGSLHAACHLITGECPCKDNVEGHNCDSCKDGTYNLDVANQQGCLHCFGYGRALTCKSAEGFVASVITSHFVNETGKYLFSVRFSDCDKI